MLSEHKVFDGKRFIIWDFLPRTKSEAKRKAISFRSKTKKARLFQYKGDWYIYLRGG